MARDLYADPGWGHMVVTRRVVRRSMLELACEADLLSEGGECEASEERRENGVSKMTTGTRAPLNKQTGMRSEDAEQ